MSGGAGARALLQAAVVARLATLGIAVFDAPPVRRALPHAVVEEPLLVDWSTKSWSGREGRLVVTIADAGERPLRLRTLADGAEAAIEALSGELGELGEGWRLVSARPVRSRLERRDAGWRATIEFAVRLYRAN